MLLPDAGWLASALAFSVAMSFTPGPNNAMVAASGANWGFRRTLPHLLGVSAGFPVMLLAIALGAGEVLRTQPWIHGVLKWAGAGYLLWLAWRIGTAEPTVATSQASPAAGRPFSFLQAALFQWVNPKAWIIAVGAVVTYTSAQAGVVLAQAMVLAALFFLAALASTAFWTMLGVGAARVLRTRRGLRAFNLAMAALLVASLVPVLLGD